MLKSWNYQLLGVTLLTSIVLIGRVVLIPISLQIFLTTVILVFLGSIYSVKVYDVKKTRDVEIMQQKDAWMFPVFGSGVLFGLFLVFKYFNKDMVNTLFHVYFSILGGYSVGCLIYERLHQLPFFEGLTKKKLFTVPVIKFISEKESPIDTLDIFSLSLGGVIGLYYYIYKTWTLNNILGIAFSVFGIENIMLGQFKVGFILLGLLFFYDIFWVFGTPVMVEVAKNLDGPIKLMFPKEIKDVYEGIKDFNMIGLGDIVIPGVYVALMLRYDLIKYFRENPNERQVSLGFKNCKYFVFTIFGYALGIVSTLAIMNFFKAAQPALLYLVPGCLLTSLLTALFRGDFSNLWNFNEETALEELKAKEK
jgi:minor histocompatibility antigen H13